MSESEFARVMAEEIKRRLRRAQAEHRFDGSPVIDLTPFAGFGLMVWALDRESAISAFDAMRGRL